MNDENRKLTLEYHKALHSLSSLLIHGKVNGQNFKEKQDICIGSKLPLPQILLITLVALIFIHKFSSSLKGWS